MGFVCIYYLFFSSALEGLEHFSAHVDQRSQAGPCCGKLEPSPPAASLGQGLEALGLMWEPGPGTGTGRSISALKGHDFSCLSRCHWLTNLGKAVQGNNRVYFSKHFPFPGPFQAHWCLRYPGLLSGFLSAQFLITDKWGEPKKSETLLFGEQICERISWTCLTELWK